MTPKPRKNPQDLQAKRDGLDLLQALADETTRSVLIRAFQTRLAQYLFDMLNPEMSDGEVLALRFKALGVVEVLTNMGVQMNKIAEHVPVQRASRETVHQAFGVDLTA